MRIRERERDLFSFILVISRNIQNRKCIPSFKSYVYFVSLATDTAVIILVVDNCQKKFVFSRFGVEAAIGYLAERDAYCGC